MIGAGVHKNPVAISSFRSFHERGPKMISLMLSTYEELVKVYSTKTLSYASDALNASSAILSQLQQGFYHKGFF
jgi:hypothetical protein